MKISTDWGLIDQVASPIVVIDRDAVISHANSAAAALFHAPSSADLKELDFSSLVLDEQEHIIQELLNDIHEVPVIQAARILDFNGDPHSVTITAGQIPDQDMSPGYLVLTLQPVVELSGPPEEKSDQSRYQDIAWLADQGRALLSLDSLDEIMDTAGQALERLLAPSIILCLTMHDEKTLRLEGIYGIENRLLDQALKLVGGDLQGRLFPIDERFRDSYTKRKLYKHPGSLADFSRSQISDRVSEQLEKLASIHDIYLIGLEGNQGVIGCYYILTREPGLNVHEELVEAYAQQVALALEKARFSVELIKSENQFKTIFEYAPDGYYLSDLQGIFLDGNLAAERITGFPRSELIGKSFLKAGLISKDQMVKAGKLLATSLMGKPTGPDEFLLNRKDGSSISVEISTYPVKIDGRSVVLGIARDISARKITNQEIKNAHETLTRVLEGIDAHVYVADMETCEILYMNKRMIEDFGGDYTGKICHKVFRSSNQICSDCTFGKILDDEGHPGDVVTWDGYNKKTGRWYRNYDRAAYWTDQRIVKLQIATDITENIQDSIALEESENRYRTLFDNAVNAVMTISPPEWRFTSANASMLQLFHFKDKAQFLDFNPWQLSPEYQPDGQLSAEKARVMIEKAVECGSNDFDWTHKKLNGEEFQARVHLSRVDLEDTYLIQASVIDITEQMEAEKILQRQMSELSLINTINYQANYSNDLEIVLEVFGQETKRLFQAINVHLYLLDEENNQLQSRMLSPIGQQGPIIERKLPVSVPEMVTIDLGTGSQFQRIISNKKAVVIRDSERIRALMEEAFMPLVPPHINRKDQSKKMAFMLQDSGIKSMAFAPLISKGKTIGLVDLVLACDFQDQDLESLKLLADQLSGIISRAQADQERRMHLTEVELISTLLQESTREDDTDLLCDRLADHVQKVNPNAYVMVSLLDPEINAIRVRALKGLGAAADRIIQVLGKRPEEIVIKDDENPLPRDLNALFTSGRLELVPGGLFDLTRGILPKRVCRTLEKIAGIGKIYIAGFGLQGRSTGGLIVLVKEGFEIQFPAAIESVVNHYAVIFERRIQKEEILKRKAQLEAVREVELSITSQLNLDVLLEAIAEKARMMVSAASCAFSIHNPHRKVLEYLAYTGQDQLPVGSSIQLGEGLSGKVWQTKETLLVDNYAEWEGRAEDWEDLGHYNLAGIPVIWGEELLGVLEIAIDREKRFTPGDIATLELFATQAAIAVKNASLYTQEQLRRHEAETLREVGLLINRMMDREDLLDMILTSLMQVVPYHSASVQLVNGSNLIVEAFVGGKASEEILGTSYAINDDLIAKQLLYEGKYVILENKEQVEEQLHGPAMEDINSCLAVPLEIKGDRVGIITLEHQQPGQYSDQDASLVKDYATQAAIALENNRLFTEIRRRTREIEVVYESALKLTQELHPSLLFEHLNQQVESLFDHDAFLLATYNPDLEEVQLEYSKEAGQRRPDHESVTSSIFERSSLLSWIIRKKSPLRIGNVEVDSLPVPPGQADKVIRSWLGVPLLVGNRVIGALVIQSYKIQAYTQDDQRLLELLANQAAIALDNSRLWEDAQMRLSRLTSLREIDMAISGSVDLEKTMEVLLDQLLDSLEVHAACVLEFNPITQTLGYVSSKGFQTKSLQHTSLRIGEGLAGRAAQERSLIHIPDLRIQETSLLRSPHFEKENFITYLAHPLIAKGELVGVLEVFHRDHLIPDPEWINFLDGLARMAAIAIDRLKLFNDLSQSNLELQHAYDATIQGWARAIELRDMGTSEHSQRVVAITLNLARKMGVDENTLTHIRRGAMLHDIGKMAIPDGILLKAGKLTDDEWKLMKKHPQYAYDMLSNIEYLRPALDIPYCHHERWDGTGYPRGLAGDAIPLAARIFAVVDVWDALQSDRSYRDAWSITEAAQYLKEESGKHFDPQIVTAFLELVGEK